MIVGSQPALLQVNIESSDRKSPCKQYGPLQDLIITCLLRRFVFYFYPALRC